MNLQVGDIVYARVTSADRDLDPVLACVDAQGKVNLQKLFTRIKSAAVMCKMLNSPLLEANTMEPRVA